MSKTTGMELPPGWASCALEDAAELIRGVAFPKEAKGTATDDGIVACLRTTNIQATVEWDDLWWIPAKYVRRAEQMVCLGDILISVANSFDLVGKVALVGVLPTRATLGAFIALIRASEPIDSRFLYYLLASDKVQRAIRSTASTTTNISNVSTNKVQATVLTIAPGNEQIRIADKLDELLSDLDAGVATLERVRKKLKHYRTAVLKAAVKGALTADWRTKHPDAEPASDLLARILAERSRRWEQAQLKKFKAAGKAPPKGWKDKYQKAAAPDTPNLPTLPEGWCWATVEQSGEVRLGRQRAPQHHYGKHMRPYLRVANVYEDRLDLTDVKEMNFTPEEFEVYALRYGDVLLNEGQSPELVGRPAMYRDEVPGCCYQKTLLRFRVYSGVSTKWALTLFRSYLHNGRFRRSASITTSIGHLAAERFIPIEFPLPPSAEQEAIVEVVEDQLSVIDHLEADLEAKLKSTQALRQSILRHAFTGQLVPQDPSDEPASELLKRIAAEREHRTRQVGSAKSLKPPARRGRRKKNAT